MTLRLLITALIFMITLPGIAREENNIADDKENPAPKFTAMVDRESVHVGDIITLTLNYTLPEGSKFTSESKIEELDDFTVLDREVKEGEIKLSILVDRTESFKIGPLSLSFKDEEDNTSIIKSDPVSMEVLSNLGKKPAEAQLKPIMEIVPTTPLWLKYLPWAAGILLLIIVVIGIIWWRKKRLRKIEELLDIRPPDVIAREEIHKLQAQRLFEKGRYKEFYFRFSEIIRQYLEKLRGFPAAEFTTEEIARRVKSEIDRKIIPLLREADLVKFADAVPAPARKDEDIRTALDYIRTTSPTPPVAQHNKGAL